MPKAKVVLPTWNTFINDDDDLDANKFMLLIAIGLLSGEMSLPESEVYDELRLSLIGIHNVMNEEDTR